MTDVTAQLCAAQAASPVLAGLDDAKRKAVLLSLADALRQDTANILAENEKDLAAMPKHDPRYDRLQLTEERIAAIAAELRTVASLPSPLGITQLERDLPNGLHIERISVPLGLVGVIYEARPNVTVDVFALCFKSGNACALKGGKEAWHSNAAFSAIISETLSSHGLPAAAATLLPPDRSAAEVLMNASGIVDVLIPRGSQGLIDSVRQNARVPVIETGAGIVHTYFDESGDVEKGRAIVFNAKTRRVSVCNALDTLIIHVNRLADLPALVSGLSEKNVEVFADPPALAALAGRYDGPLRPAQEDSFGCEFLSYKMAVKSVPSLDAALAHIRAHSSRHSEAIIAEDEATIERFLREVDAAAVYANASTAFTDGGQFGMGAEIGISTQKLHARGPMGLEALTSYKWVVRGNGQTRR
ncbi:MAG TPA: glutamate-5-semialdehyde dehydrogenase [Patescibacteria group bacterium]|nr:glutamate-5-semialdehyde dehydrogenase [Patescibacteria group bacterium]